MFNFKTFKKRITNYTAVDSPPRIILASTTTASLIYLRNSESIIFPVRLEPALAS